MLHIDAVVQGSHESHHALQAGRWEGGVEGACRQSVRVQSDLTAEWILARQPQDNMLQVGRLQGRLQSPADWVWECSQRWLHVHSLAHNVASVTAASCQG